MGARIEQIETSIARLNPCGDLTYVELAAALNNDDVPTLSGRAEWNKYLVHQFLKKVGRSRTRTELKERGMFRSALNGIVRRSGKMSATRMADELNKSGVRTLSGKGMWTAKRVCFLYLRLGRVKKSKFWTKARVERVRELHQSGETQPQLPTNSSKRASPRPRCRACCGKQRIPRIRSAGGGADDDVAARSVWRRRTHALQFACGLVLARETSIAESSSPAAISPPANTSA